MDPTLFSPNYTMVFEFEKQFNKDANKVWMEKHWSKVFYFIGAYLLFIYFGQKYMKSRQPYGLRKQLAIWNTALAIFSILGTSRTFPELIHVFKEFGFTFSVCNSSYIEVTKVTGEWAWLFALSKVIELGDTVFIVLRKQKLIFLHWYHHITVLLLCFYAYKEHTSTARWLIVMNYFVHSFMYSYFALKSVGFKIPSLISMAITIIQLLQMVTFCAVSTWAYISKSSGYDCQISEGILTFAFCLALSYFFLFANFFYKTYIHSKSQQKLSKMVKTQ
ncbi:very long chain fatty acid elongase 6-like [Centruroides vittatus]|uniref:very long chain fatty acid elongase 6-like n=1 Tax=Centruroides vittatus TaxID=120091 RepID=UPI0035108FA4